jgi:hypothetical protein
MFGRHFRGACQMDISLSHTGMTALAMMGEPGNLYVEFTPDGLRQMASHLLDAAAKAEAIGAEHARTQLAAALAKREGRPDARRAPAAPDKIDLAASEAQRRRRPMWARLIAWLFFGFCLLAAIITSAAR